MTGIETLVRSLPTSFFAMSQRGIFLFSSHRKGSYVLEYLLQNIFVIILKNVNKLVNKVVKER